MGLPSVPGSRGQLPLIAKNAMNGAQISRFSVILMAGTPAQLPLIAKYAMNGTQISRLRVILMAGARAKRNRDQVSGARDQKRKGLGRGGRDGLGGASIDFWIRGGAGVLSLAQVGIWPFLGLRARQVICPL